jgi:hypothetical protein
MQFCVAAKHAIVSDFVFGFLGLVFLDFAPPAASQAASSSACCVAFQLFSLVAMDTALVVRKWQAGQQGLQAPSAGWKPLCVCCHVLPYASVFLGRHNFPGPALLATVALAL